jgi:hypothetical protein
MTPLQKRLAQQNSCNLMSDNVEISIIQHLETAAPTPEVLLLYQPPPQKKSLINETGHIQKGLQEFLYISHG